MFLAATFSPMSMSGSFNTQIPVGGRFIVYNESQIGLNLTFDNNDSVYVPAWSADIYTLPTRNPLVNWSQNNTLNSGSPPLATVNIVSYLPNERVTGYFPFALTRQQNIGNSIPVSTSATSVVNDGNAANTQVVESTVSGSPGSNFVLQNQGSLIISQWISGSLTQILKTDPGAASVVKLGNVGLVTESLGSLTIDQLLTCSGNELHANNTTVQWNDTGGTARSVLQVNNFNQTQLFGIQGTNLFQMLQNTGTIQMSVDLVLGLITMRGSTQTVSGDTSGTMSLQEIGGGLIKFAVLTQTGFRQAGGANLITMKQKFNNFVWVLNGGCGGVQLSNNGASQTFNQVAWGTSGNAGSSAAQSFCPTMSGGFVNSGVDSVGAFGGDSSGHTGVTILIGT